MNKGLAIAIDGPVAAGKGTIAPKLAKTLNGFYLYTGSMYRCLGLYCLDNSVDINNEKKVVDALGKIKIQFNKNKILLNGIDVKDRIKSEKIGFAASTVSLYKKVRIQMVKKQQEIANKFLKSGTAVVAEGRDTATNVLPTANLKVFLTASVGVRAKRRLRQLGQTASKENFTKVLKEIEKRDKQDIERKIDPLVKNPQRFGYFVLDNSNLSKIETIKAIISRVK